MATGGTNYSLRLMTEVIDFASATTFLPTLETAVEVRYGRVNTSKAI